MHFLDAQASLEMVMTLLVNGVADFFVRYMEPTKPPDFTTVQPYNTTIKPHNKKTKTDRSRQKQTKNK